MTTMKLDFPLAIAESTRLRIRLASLALFAAGLCFVLYPAFRPFSDEASLQGAEAFASGRWVVAHVLAIIGFVLLTYGLYGLHLRLQATGAERTAFLALAFGGLGVGLTLPFYGAEVYGLHVIGLEAIRLQNADLIRLADAIRSGPGLVMFVIGLVLLAVGAIYSCIAVWKSRVMAKWCAAPLTVGLLLYLPQFIAAQPMRIAHGALVAIGCMWLAAAMRTEKS
ncbi:hypothetical protein ACFFNY_27745 [Paenibacillus hodogayensis]|uniref:DUF4386 family protein n=1 Tax=Paenibacillus hodogayensis TaxID=279208 RepID=A0ABV5W490_9BACL